MIIGRSGPARVVFGDFEGKTVQEIVREYLRDDKKYSLIQEENFGADPLEITMDKIIIKEKAILFPVASENSGRAHIWFLDSDLMIPSASYEITDKSLVSYTISRRQTIYVYFNRIMAKFAIIPINN